MAGSTASSLAGQRGNDSVRYQLTTLLRRGSPSITDRLAQEGSFTLNKIHSAQDDRELGKQGAFLLEDGAVGLGEEGNGRLSAVSSQHHVCDGRRLTTACRGITKFACQWRTVRAERYVGGFRRVCLR